MAALDGTAHSWELRGCNGKGGADAARHGASRARCRVREIED